MNAEKALGTLGLSASVVAADVASVRAVAEDANVILTSQEFVEAIGETYAEVIVIRNTSTRARSRPRSTGRSGALSSSRRCL